MLELYHNINSVCAQKVRIALDEKGQQVKEHLLTLQGDQFEPAYMKLNPNGVVPTLIHDGKVDHRILADPLLHRRRLSRSAADAEDAGRAPSRPALQQADRRIHAQRLHDHDLRDGIPAALPEMTRELWLAEINKSPLKRRAEYKRSVIEHGLDSEFVADALGQHQKMISWMADDLKRGPYLAGDAFSNADCAVIPYILRLELLKLGAMWDRYRRRRLVGARAGAAVGQGCDLRSHDRGRLGAVQEPRARSLAESADVVESGVRPGELATPHSDGVS